MLDVTLSSYDNVEKVGARRIEGKVVSWWQWAWRGRSSKRSHEEIKIEPSMVLPLGDQDVEEAGRAVHGEQHGGPEDHDSEEGLTQISTSLQKQLMQFADLWTHCRPRKSSVFTA